MTKREKLILSYKITIGVADINDYADRLPVETIDEIKLFAKFRDKTNMSKEVKEMAVKTFEIAVDVTEKEKGGNYTKEDVFQTFVHLMLMTDPKNLISPISMNNIEKN